MDRSPNKIVERFRGAKVLVIGDAMLDVYLRGVSERVCREAPVQVVEVTAEQKMAGGAANSAVNCADLGAEVFFISSAGTDEEGEALLHILTERRVHTSDVFRIRGRKTVTKERIFANDHMLLRFDKGRREPLPNELRAQVVEALERLYPEMDAVMISDYEYGLLGDEVVTALRSLQEQHGKPLLVDSRYLAKYSDFAAAVIKPNYEEVVSFLGTGGSPAAEDRVQWVRRHGEELLHKTGASIAAITMDALGSLVFERGQAPYRTYSRPVQSTRAVGAGDTYSSVFLLALSQGVGAGYAAELASIAASLVLDKVGTATCSLAELQAVLLSHRKHIDAQGLEQLVRRYREQGKKIVFTNGCFDILHAGHINYLNQAKALGDVMIVGMNDDQSIRRLKGQGRPINTLSDRVQVLAGLSSVDHIVAFAQDSPEQLIERIRPDVYAKGTDYTRETLPEAPLVESLGGTVEFIPVTGGKSTTNIIRRIREGSVIV